jgi:CRP-like cAMP-binding protein
MQSTYQLSPIGPIRADPALAALLRRDGRPIAYAAGQMIQQQGDSSDGFWMIESGRVAICRFGVDGGVTVFGVLGAGDLFGELAYFAGTTRQVDAVAEEPAVLVRVGATQVEQLLAQEPDFARALLASLAHQLRLALDQIDRDRSLTAEARIARLLLDLAERDGSELFITQQSLADRAGVSRVTAGQVLAQLEQVGAICRGYRRISVANRVELELRGLLFVR